MPSSPQESAVSAPQFDAAHQLLLIGTGGTIAGWAPDPLRSSTYRAGALGLDALVAATPALQSLQAREALSLQALAQIDSKDMSFELWARLAQTVKLAGENPAIAAILITHGTDTLEETAYFLHRVLKLNKPVVLTGAMLPANAPDADGPVNVADALAFLEANREAAGVWVVFAHQLFTPPGLRKWHVRDRAAFAQVGRSASDPMPVLMPARPGGLRAQLDFANNHYPPGAYSGLSLNPSAAWPWVEIITSATGCDGRAVDALVQAGVQGLVVAGTGHGTIHAGFTTALQTAAQRGVKIIVASRVGQGLVDRSLAFGTCAYELSPAQARVELILQLSQA